MLEIRQLWKASKYSCNLHLCGTRARARSVMQRVTFHSGRCIESAVYAIHDCSISEQAIIADIRGREDRCESGS